MVDHVPAPFKIQVSCDALSEEKRHDTKARSANYDTKPRSLLFSGGKQFRGMRAEGHINADINREALGPSRIP